MRQSEETFPPANQCTVWLAIVCVPTVPKTEPVVLICQTQAHQNSWCAAHLHSQINIFQFWFWEWSLDSGGWPSALTSWRVKETQKSKLFHHTSTISDSRIRCAIYFPLCSPLPIHDLIVDLKVAQLELWHCFVLHLTDEYLLCRSAFRISEAANGYHIHSPVALTGAW